MSGFDQTLFISSIVVVKLTPAIVLFMTLTVFVEFLIFFLDSESHDLAYRSSCLPSCAVISEA